MKKSIIVLIFLIIFTGFVSADIFDKFSVTVGILNDNLLIWYDAVKAGWSLGPDDQYSFSQVIQLSYLNWDLNYHNTSVTSRKNLYRFDIMTFSLFYTHNFINGDLALRGGIGINGCGDFGGESLQNWWHGILSFEQVHIPYLENSCGLYFGIGADYRFLTLAGGRMNFKAFMDIDCYTNTGLNTVKGGAIFNLYSRYVDIEVNTGLEYHFLLEDDLERITSSGFFAAALFTAKIKNHLRLTSGIGVFPVKNVEDPPDFDDIDYPCIPQLWYIFTVGKKNLTLRNSPVP